MTNPKNKQKINKNHELNYRLDLILFTFIRVERELLHPLNLALITPFKGSLIIVRHSMADNFYEPLSMNLI